MRAILCTGSGLRFERTRDIISDGDDFISVIVNLGKSCVAAQRGREVALGSGDGVAVLHSEPATVAFAPGSYFSVMVPRSAMASRLREVDDAAMHPLQQGATPLGLLMNYVRFVEDELASAEPGLRRLIVNHIHDLVALVLGAEPAATVQCRKAVAAARLGAVLADIEANFQEAGLSTVTVARRIGISSRYLQRLLERSGVSFTERVNELRLQRAFALLTDPDCDGRRIADIALDVGFSDVSHFNRLFRPRFGDTPSGVRACRRQ